METNKEGIAAFTLAIVIVARRILQQTAEFVFPFAGAECIGHSPVADLDATELAGAQ